MFLVDKLVGQVDQFLREQRLEDLNRKIQARLWWIRTRPGFGLSNEMRLHVQNKRQCAKHSIREESLQRYT